MDTDPVKEMTAQLNGAEAIDINTGPLTSNPEGKMEFLVRSIQEVTDLPIMHKRPFSVLEL